MLLKESEMLSSIEAGDDCCKLQPENVAMKFGSINEKVRRVKNWSQG